MAKHNYPSWFREIDHTGDLGIEVMGESLDVLFERAAWGMFAMITDLSEVQIIEQQTITINDTDRDALLRRWLSELNYRHITEEYLFCQFRITELMDQHLLATVGGEPIDRSRHRIYTEIKAVTFHGMRIERLSSGWLARIIFDM